MNNFRLLCHLLAISAFALSSANAANPKTSTLLTGLLNNPLASGSGATIIPDPAFLLQRDGDRIRATVVGTLHSGRYAGEIEVLATRDQWATLWVTRNGLARLERDPDIRAIYPPLKPQLLAVASEGLGAMGWGAYNSRGVGGQGVRVAIIDVGFAGHEALLGRELPSSVYVKSFISPAQQPFYADEDHGTAVAEIVHDVAPQADLSFLSVAETSDIFDAVSWCIDHDIQVVNMSLGFSAGPRDGTSVVSKEIDRAAAAGIIWANAAGNQGFAHWGGTWTDANTNNYLEFSPGVEAIAIQWTSNGGVLSLVRNELIWDRWPTTEGLSFDLELYYDAARTQLLVSSNNGPTFNLAYRRVVLDNPLAGHTYYMAIKRTQGTVPAGLRMEFYSDDATVSMAPRNSTSSLTIPADARGAVTVGAYDYGQTVPGTTPIRAYSGQGPTWDGRMKPEIAAADGVTTATYGSHGFYGTSASSPHIAGAAALLASASVSGGLFTYVWSPEDFIRLMAANSIDFGTPGNDNTYGTGGAVLPPASASPDSFSVARAYPNPSNAGLTIHFAARPGTSYALRIYDVLGRLVWQTEALHVARGEARVHWTGKDRQGRDVGSGVYFYRIDTDTQTLHGKAVILK